MKRKLVVFGTSIFLVAGLAAVFASPSRALSSAQVAPFVQPPSGAVAAQGDDVTLRVVAVRGTLSAFWGSVTQFHDGIWLMENGQGTSIVIASEVTLTAYFPDGRAPVVAKVEKGEPRDFMNLLLIEAGQVDGEGTCGDCTTQQCCDIHCGGETSCRWCLCSARVSCTNGIQSYSCTAGVSCQFVCLGSGK